MEALRTRSRSPRSGDKRRVHCELCDKTFAARGPYERICRTCKHDSELYRFSDWLPDLEPELIDWLDPVDLKSTG